jgi:hypothetical protein
MDYAFSLHIRLNEDLSIENNQKQVIMTYPNPSTDKITLINSICKTHFSKPLYLLRSWIRSYLYTPLGKLLIVIESSKTPSQKMWKHC